MTTSILEGILKPSQELDGIRYYNGEDVILLAAAVSDFGRDYYVQDPSGSSREPISIGDAILTIYSGDVVPDPELEVRLKRILEDFPELPLMAIEAFGKFSYEDPREPGAEIIFDPLGKHLDIPQRFLGRLAGAHHSAMKRILKELMATDGFVGEIKGRINGLDLRYFESQLITPRGNGPYDSSFYLHYFYDEEGHLLAWKTGMVPHFLRDGLYTVIGGSVKAHDRYPGQPPKTVISRAKFFDHSTGEQY